jgi:hypothetical protein
MHTIGAEDGVVVNTACPEVLSSSTFSRSTMILREICVAVSTFDSKVMSWKAQPNCHSQVAWSSSTARSFSMNGGRQLWHHGNGIPTTLYGP